MNVVNLIKQKEIYIKSKFGIAKIGVFGSFARCEDKAESDIDILVEFKPGYTTFDNYIELKFYLEKLFGRDIDLVTIKALKSQIKSEILKEVIYA